MNPVDANGQPMRKGIELKLSREDVRHYLQGAARMDPADSLRSALVAEGVVAGDGRSKPTDLYFTAGNQKFLDIGRKVLEGATREDILQGLQGPWLYRSKLPSLMWDVADDRIYALRAYDPQSSGEKKRTNPGPEALAVLGLSLHPVFAGQERTLTQGCSGKWTRGFYSWPLWSRPASLNSVRSLLAHAYDHDGDRDREERRSWFRAWGVASVLKAPIRRSSQGGYGTFGPPEVAWQEPDRR